MQSLLDQCALHFPLLLPWTQWCYRQHSFLRHSMGTLTLETGVQQGNPLGPFYFALVMHHLVLTIAKDDSCQDLLFNAWYLDDGVVAGPSSSVQHVVHQDLGPSLGLHLNPPKCELFSQGDLSLFPSEMNKSCTPNLTILGAPIGDVAFCSSFIAPNVLLLPYCYPLWRSLAHVILRLLSFCYACVMDLLNWSTLHGPLLHPWH